jgi:hypothetical protein
MSLVFDVRVERPRLTVHEGLRLSVQIENQSVGAVELPSTFDESGALAIDVTLDEGRRRRMSGLTSQAMLTTGRVDPRPMLDTLAAGGRWTDTLDLASFHYPLPAGRHLVEAKFDFEPGDIHLRSGPHPIEVSDAPVSRVVALRDRAILDGIVLILEARGAQGYEYYLRQHNFGRPLAAWYSERILEGVQVESVFCASAAFDDAETFDPFWDRWVLWRHRRTLSARLHRWGGALGEIRRAPFPEGRELVASAGQSLDGEVRVFFASPGGRLECYRLGARSLEPVFERQFPDLSPSRSLVRCDGDAFHVILAGQRIRYGRLTHQGEVVDQRAFAVTRTPLHTIDFEPRSGVLKAACWDAPHGTTLQLLAMNVDSGEEHRLDIDHVPLRGGIREVALDVNPGGRLRALVSTPRGGLYYLGENVAPALIASGSGPFHPVVAAGQRTYLGCSRPGLGYRFLELGRKGGPRALDYELLA